MKTILEIDSCHYLLPDSVNVHTLLQMLKKAQKLERRWKVNYNQFTIEGPVKLSISVVADNLVITPPKPKQIAEKASPEANGDMGI